MSSGRKSPLLSFTLTEMLNSTAQSTNPSTNATLPDDDLEASRKRWYHYLPLCGTIFLILAPQPSWLWILVDFHLQTLHRPGLFIIHLLVSYILMFMMFSSLLVCLIRDPGPLTVPSISECVTGEGEEIGLRAALLSDDDDFTSPNKWCRKCWAPKPERAHHCSICGRCVLKMDHHCPWLGAKCIGHRTYPAFIHFLCTISLLATYFALVCGHALWYSFNHPFDSGAYTPVHELALTFYGSTFALFIGSFAGYHLYLTSTNQTTIENITPFLLLRHLPRLPRNGHSLSDPPLEPELSFPQRRLVRDAHSQLSLYDIGFRKNWTQTFGWRTKRELFHRLWWGGASPGDGMTFPKNRRSEEVLAKLAKGLANLDIDR